MKLRYLICLLLIFGVVSCQESEVEIEQKRQQDSLQVVNYIDSILHVNKWDYSETVRDEFNQMRKTLFDSIQQWAFYPNQKRDSIILETRLAYERVQPQVRYWPPSFENDKGEMVSYIRLVEFESPKRMTKLEQFLNDTINPNLYLPQSCFDSTEFISYVISFKQAHRMEELKIMTAGNQKQFPSVEAEISRLLHIYPFRTNFLFLHKNNITKQFADEQKDYVHRKIKFSIDKNGHVSLEDLIKEKSVQKQIEEKGGVPNFKSTSSQ